LFWEEGLKVPLTDVAFKGGESVFVVKVGSGAD
jgi:hypothetical protein